MRRRLGFSLLLAGALATAGCGGNPVTGLAVGGAGNVFISVGPGVTPTIAWTGGDATRLTVSRANGGGVFWDIQALDPQLGFSPSVLFGVVPDRAFQNGPLTPLTRGIDYRVNVTLEDGGSGTRIFRP